LIKCKKCQKKNNEFSIEEYTSIRAELIERIKIMNSQEASGVS